MNPLTAKSKPFCKRSKDVDPRLKSLRVVAVLDGSGSTACSCNDLILKVQSEYDGESSSLRTRPE